MENFMFWTITGLAVGLLTRMVVQGDRFGGLFGDLMVGAAGAILGGWLYNTYMGAGNGGWIGSILCTLSGSFTLLFLLFIARFIYPKSRVA